MKLVSHSNGSSVHGKIRISWMYLSPSIINEAFQPYYLPPSWSIPRLWLIFIVEQVDFVFCGLLLRTILTVSILEGVIRLRLISRTILCPLGELRLL